MAIVAILGGSIRSVVKANHPHQRCMEMIGPGDGSHADRWEERAWL